MTAEPVYEELYEKVWWLAVDADELRSELLRRAQKRGFPRLEETLEQSQARVVGASLPPEYLQAMSDQATTEEKANKLFPIATSRFPVEALARVAVRNFGLSERDVERLQRIHELRWARSLEVVGYPGLKRTVLVAIATLTLIGTLLPREVFGSDDSYADFRILLIVVFCFVVLGALFLFWFISWRHLRKRQKRAKLTRTLLDFCEVVVQEDEQQGRGGVGAGARAAR